MGLQILSPLNGAYKITTSFTGKVILGPLKGQQHNSVDYATPIGTPIYAVTDGVIKRADSTDEWGGNRITLENVQAGLQADYAHLQSMYVQPGQAVKAGQILGTTGNSGKATTGPHLLFGVKLNGKPVDPEAIINGLVSPSSVNATLANITPPDWFAYLKILVSSNQPTWGDALEADRSVDDASRVKVQSVLIKLGMLEDKPALGAIPTIAAKLTGLPGTNNGTPLDAAIAVGSFLGSISNPGNWAKFLAIAGGAGMIVWGGVILYQAS